MNYLLTLFDFPYLCYLSRYISVAALAIAALLLLFTSYKRSQRRFIEQKENVEGYFLLADNLEAEDQVLHFPLYFRTAIGKALSSDIRIKSRGVKRHHAEIYLFSGKWYISKINSRAEILVNDRKITKDKQLRHGDVIQMGDRSFSFFDEYKLESRRRNHSRLDSAEEEIVGTGEKTAKISRNLLFIYVLLFIAQVFAILPQDLASLKPICIIMSAFFSILVLTSAFLWPRIFRYFDDLCFTALAFLMTLGFFVQVRLSFLNRSMPATSDWNRDKWLEFLSSDIFKQSLFPLMGLIVMPVIIWLIARTGILEWLAPVCLVLTPALYVITLIFAKDIAGTGARLWIPLPGGLSFQASEFAKISYLISLAWTFKTKLDYKRQLYFLAWALANFVLIVLLPDLGSLMILLPITVVVFLVMTSEYIKTGLILTGGSLLFYLSYRFMPYIRKRIYGWLTLWEQTNPQNDQIISGLKAIARGGLFGSGLGRSEPRAIPLASSDMIFPFLSEELGLITALSIVILFMIIWLRGAESFMLTRDSFSAALILGISSYFFVEAAVVIAGSVGLIPLTGATLPFIARGGSSMISKYLLAAVLLGLANRRNQRIPG